MFKFHLHNSDQAFPPFDATG